MKSFYYLTIASILLLSPLFSAKAWDHYDFEVNGLYYGVISLEELTCACVSRDRRDLYPYTDIHPDYSEHRGKDIVIPSSVKFGERTFTVTEIKEYAFKESGIKSVIIPGSVSVIGIGAFEQCVSLKKVVLEDGVTIIGAGCFKGCESLMSLTLSSTLREIGDAAFAGCRNVRNTFVVPQTCSSLGDVPIGVSVRILDGPTPLSAHTYSFSSCNGDTIYIGRDLSGKNSVLYKGLLNFRNIVLGDRVTCFPFGTREASTPIDNLTIGRSILEVPNVLLEIKTIYIRNRRPPQAKGFLNKTYVDATLYVPKGTLEIYKQADVWKNFLTIKEIEMDGISSEVITVTTTEVGDLKASSVALHGKLSVKDGANVLDGEIGFFISPSKKTLTEIKSAGLSYKKNGKFTPGAFSIQVKKLKPSQKYYYVAYFKNGDGEYYGQVNSFTTMQIQTKITALPTDNIELFSARLRGNIEIDDSKKISKVWFLYDANASTWEDLQEKGRRSEAKVPDNGHVVASIDKLTPSQKYYYVACMMVKEKVVHSEVKTFSTKTRLVPPGAVEMGLSVLWASVNIGAKFPEEFGDYYAWGETEIKSKYTIANYKWKQGKENSKYTFAFMPMPLAHEDDVAYKVKGGEWRIPSKEEWVELREQCVWTWGEINGIPGYHIKSKKNGASIFLPAAGLKMGTKCIGEKEVGDYWMSDGTEGGYNFKKGLKYGELVGPQEHRYVGMSVRPVFGGMPSYAPSVSYLHYKAPPMKKIVFNWYGRTK